MSIEVNPLEGFQPTDKALSTPQATESVVGDGFSSVLSDAIKHVDSLSKASAGTFEGFVKGDVKDLHEVMVAMGKADITFRYALEVRNKLIEAYQEVSRMRV